MSKRLVIRAFLLMLVSAGFVLAGDKAAACGDLLAELHKQPKELEFMSCSRRMDLQTKPWRALYRVRGAHAAEVEKFFVSEVRMRKLEHTCCLWDSSLNSYEPKDGRGFIISMSSEETGIGRRD